MDNQVYAHDDKNVISKPPSPEHGAYDEDDAGDHGKPGRDRSGGQGSLPFHRVVAVGLQIDQIVEDVNGTGQCAKCYHGLYALDQFMDAENLLREHQRGQDKTVFYPLVGTK